MFSQSKNLANAPAIYDIVKEEDKSSLNIWLAIETKILELQAESSPKLKIKIAREISVMLAEKLTTIFELFIKYPVIKERYEQYGPITSQLSSYMNANVVALQQSAVEYFKHLYPNADPSKDFTFFNKNDGVQVGQVLKISYIDVEKQRREVSYFIKTHQNGSTSQGGGAGAVDLKELFVYKALENMHLGPKAHFFTTGMSGQNGFYIATRGFPFSKSAAKQNNKLFYTYSKFIEEKNLEEATALPSVDMQVVHGLAMIDIISRIFKLSDVATNDGNFGFALNGEKIKVKIVDFRVGMDGDIYTYGEGALLQGFIVGNGAYNYLKFVRTALRNRLSIDKIAEAQAAIKYLRESTKFSFYTAIKQAYEEVCNYANANNGVWVPAAALFAALTDLETYFEAVVENFSTFVRDVASRATTQKLTLKG